MPAPPGPKAVQTAYNSHQENAAPAPGGAGAALLQVFTPPGPQAVRSAIRTWPGVSNAVVRVWSLPLEYLRTARGSARAGQGERGQRVLHPGQGPSIRDQEIFSRQGCVYGGLCWGCVRAVRGVRPRRYALLPHVMGLAASLVHESRNGSVASVARTIAMVMLSTLGTPDPRNQRASS